MASKRNTIADPNSCLNKASDAEPLFVLRANDELAPLVVRDWAYRYYASKGKMITNNQLKKYNEAMNCAAFMEHWKENHQEEKHHVEKSDGVVAPTRP